MLKHFATALWLFPSLASAQTATYLVEPSLAACQARSASQCTQLGCDGTLTRFWWSCQVLATATATGGATGTGGTSAITIQPATPFDVTTTNKIAPSPTGLSTTEQAAVQTVTQLGTALPYVISEPTWVANLTAPELAAITANNILNTELNALKAAATVNLNAANVQTFLSGALAAGAITQTTYAAMSTPKPTITTP
jgi:hypothetical protein